MQGAWFRDPWLYAVLGLAPSAWLLPEPTQTIAVWRLVFLALAEEVLFRGMFQDWLRGRPCFLRRVGPVTKANIVASLCFMAVHFVVQPPLWAVAVFIPSLIFGWIWDRHRRILPCTLVHFTYNFCFFYRL